MIVPVTCGVCVYMCAHALGSVCMSACVTESAARSVK